jgi:hypothetical protein
VAFAIIVDSMGGVNPPLYGGEVVSQEVQFLVAGAAEVAEDLFEFSPVVFGRAFYAGCEEGYNCLYIAACSFAQE